jgi:hypothetical protein
VPPLFGTYITKLFNKSQRFHGEKMMKFKVNRLKPEEVKISATHNIGCLQWIDRFVAQEDFIALNCSKSKANSKRQRLQQVPDFLK